MRKTLLILTMGVLMLACTTQLSDQTTALPEHYYPQPGDTIAVISPSALPDSAQLLATVAGLEKWGYVPLVGQYAVADVRTLDDCISDLMWALCEPSVRAIYCIRGGYASTEVMDRLPLDSIRLHPKPIIGYSDITIYHSAWTSLGLPSIHSSMSATFMDLPEECAELQRQMMSGKMPHYHFPSGDYHRCGTAEGILIGGNLATFTAAMLTDYDCTRTNKPLILMLEDVEDTYQSAHRAFTILSHMGILNRVEAIMLGDWADFSDGTCYSGDSRGGSWLSIYEMLNRQFLSDMNIPVATGIHFGHGEQNYPMRMGAPIRLTVTDDTTEIEFL